MRALLIEDELSILRSIEIILTSEGLGVHSCDLGAEGLELGKHGNYDVILLDLNLPDMHGFDVLNKLRLAKVHTPVLILSGVADLDAKVRSFASGADDYVTKPFHRDELVARVQAVLRRSRNHAEPVVRTGRLAVNLDTQTAEVDAVRLNLTCKEFAILELLSRRKGAALTKDACLNHLYGGIDAPDVKIIDVFMCALRKKLAAATGGDTYIETVWGRGYILRDPAEKDLAA